MPCSMLGPIYFVKLKLFQRYRMRSSVLNLAGDKSVGSWKLETGYLKNKYHIL